MSKKVNQQNNKKTKMAEDRIDRARKQRIRLMSSNVDYEKKECKFLINGTGIRTYEVVWDFENTRFTCECPDHEHRKRDCKHIYFVMIQALKLKKPEDVDLVDIDDAIRNFDKDKLTYTNNSEKDVVVKQRMNDECCICLLEFEDTSSEKTSFCVRQCGVTFHSDCLSQLFKVLKNKKCPMCRSDMK